MNKPKPPTEPPIFRTALILADVLRHAIAFYSRSTPADTATANRAVYVIACLQAIAERRALPMLGADAEKASL